MRLACQDIVAHNLAHFDPTSYRTSSTLRSQTTSSQLFQIEQDDEAVSPPLPETDYRMLINVCRTKSKLSMSPNYLPVSRIAITSNIEDTITAGRFGQMLTAL